MQLTSVDQMHNEQIVRLEIRLDGTKKYYVVGKVRVYSQGAVFVSHANMHLKTAGAMTYYGLGASLKLSHLHGQLSGIGFNLLGVFTTCLGELAQYTSDCETNKKGVGLLEVPTPHEEPEEDDLIANGNGMQNAEFLKWISQQPAPSVTSAKWHHEDQDSPPKSPPTQKSNSDKTNLAALVRHCEWIVAQHPTTECVVENTEDILKEIQCKH